MHPVPTLTADNRASLPFAVDEAGEPIVWDLTSSAPHMLVAGTSGAGKTAAITGLVMEASLRDWPIWIVDPKRIEFLELHEWPNVQVVAADIPEQVVVLNAAHALMEHRYEMIQNGEASSAHLEPLILVLDEFDDFHRTVADWYASIKAPGMPSLCPVFEKLSAITRKGRAARIHVLIGVQTPDCASLGGELRDNLATRLTLGPLSPHTPAMMGHAPGAATAARGDDQPVDVHTYWTTSRRRGLPGLSAEDPARLNNRRPKHTTHPKLTVHLDQQLMQERDQQFHPMVWQAITRAQLLPLERGTSDTDGNPA